ncbi:hypothetical protein ACQEU5_14860 [Marinactinospora thermotolerans]|uniref:hypothetical protein n=1 Tax=Marinactinospora thermotolerans TaxID=531310 RepID=UPI001F309207|nr:hypothetical protein [Marinactinospora thermotolerans]
MAQRLEADGRTAHLVWNPLTGETVQLLPATACAEGQLTTGGPDRAREGRVCVLIQVIGHSLRPFTDGPLAGLDPILDWLDSWSVPRRWPAGPPPAASPYSRGCSDHLWAQGGHFGHSQVPGVSSASPGGIDPQRLLGRSVPRPRDGSAASVSVAPFPQVGHNGNGIREHVTASPI